METGQLFTFYIQKEEENGDVYLCVKCPSNKIKFTFGENADWHKAGFMVYYI